MNSSDGGWRQVLLPEGSTVQQAISNLDDSSRKIVLIVTAEGRLAGTISDGDIRRGLLKGMDLKSPVESVLHREAFVVPPTMARESVMQLMIANKIYQIPVVDEDQRVVGLHLWDELATPPSRSNLMIIMAGGKGTRLRPHTESCPKPLVPVAGRPILEHIIERAKAEGFSRFVLTTHYLAHMIVERFGDGSSLGVQIEYVTEKSPLGTAGALSLLPTLPSAPFVVTNGDVITNIRYGELLDFHSAQNASATMAVRVHEWQHPYGVVQTNGIEIVGFQEKPIARSHINAGVYALSPDALTELEYDAPCDMPTLFERLHARAKRTVAYAMHEPWLDVGEPSDLVKANGRVASERAKGTDS
ncbi:CBS domain-containing protein [bacterium]|nr:CBS domain-containing protein [bacterium]